MADDIERARAERVILWQRCVPTADGEGIAPQAWFDQVLARVRANGGQVLAGIGSTVVASFDSIELFDIVELARALVVDAARDAGGVKVVIGLALGEVEEVDEAGRGFTYRGAVLDRAQALAHRARAFEVVLDEVALAPASEHFLFAREVVAGEVRGRALDAENPRKQACRKALSALKPAPIAHSVLPVFEALREKVQLPGQTRIAIHSSMASLPLELVDRLAVAVPPSIRLRVSRKAGGLQPLGGLSLAVRRLWPEDSDLEGAGLPPALRAKLKALLRGQGVSRSQSVETLVELLRAYHQQGARPWVVLDQLHEIDPGTLGVIAETAMTASLDFVLLMTLPNETHVPAAFLAKSEVHEHVIPTLRLSDRRALAEAVLSLEPESDVALRVALLGGESELGIVEAARTLVSAGDLVRRGDTFAWRTGPRSTTTAVPVESLITERALGLPPDAYRTLEAICVSPPDATRDMLRAVMTRDGLGPEEIDTGLRQLVDEGFVDESLSLGTSDATIRGALRNNMPPARAAELHRFVAAVLRARLKAPGFGSAQLAYHLAEGGQEAEAASALIDAARSAVEASFQRVALRLLATAVELDGSNETRKLASEIASLADAAGAQARAAAAAISGSATGDKSDRPPPLSTVPPNMAESSMLSARRALVDRDFDAVERWLDTAMAAGWGRAAAQRFLAIAQLAQGHANDATITLSRVSARDAPAPVRARDALGWALIHLESGDALLATRDALDSLAASRRLRDVRGEEAALQVLACCFRSGGRDAEAVRIESLIALRTG